MAFLAGWIVCGSIATIWYMVLITFNVGGEADFMDNEYFKFIPDNFRTVMLLLIVLALFIIGPIGLADVLNTEYKNWRNRKKS